MPSSTRHWARRELRRASDQINWVGTHVVRVAEVYEKQHPEISAPLYEAAKYFQDLQTVLEKVRESI